MKESIQTTKAPAAIGPYSQAVKAGQLLFVSGQLGSDPASGELASGIEAQTRRAIENLGAILEAAGLSLSDVVRTGIFLADLAGFQKVNAIYAEYFTSSFPARSTVEVSRLPRDAEVEIEAVALFPS